MLSRRKSLFISHANPEDNAFTLWLGARLSALGYDVWADILKLAGGYDWQRRLETALREETGKLLFVGTPEAAGKQLVRNEVQIGYTVSKQLGDPEFIIPLRLKPFGAPFLIAHAQYISFQNRWSEGLAELTDTLENTYKFPRDENSSENTAYWQAVQLVHARRVIDEEETLPSNWLAIESLPPKVRVFDFKAGINVGQKQLALDNLKTPVTLFGRGFVGFGSTDEYQSLLGEDLPLLLLAELDTDEFLTEGCPVPKIAPQDARNFIASILRQSLETNLSERGLSAFAMASRSKLFWPSIKVQPPEYVSFNWDGGPSGRRQITGQSSSRNFYWHLGVAVRPRFFPIRHVRIGLHVIFSLNGVVPIPETEKMHRWRRSFCKSWRNARWRDMLLAFVYWWSGNSRCIQISTSPATSLVLTVPPLEFVSPVRPDHDSRDSEDGEEADQDDSDAASPDDLDDDDGLTEPPPDEIS